jgi:hypothetical protein
VAHPVSTIVPEVHTQESKDPCPRRIPGQLEVTEVLINPDVQSELCPFEKNTEIWKKEKL